MSTTENTGQKRSALIQARLRRGWTQADLAENMGVATKTVARWEAGSTVPFPLYRAKLRELLDIDPEAIWPLRFASTAPAKEGEPQPASPVSLEPPVVRSSTALVDSALPPLPEGIRTLVGREKLLNQLRTCFSTAGVPLHVALHGLPGVGKTSVAIALAHDATLHERFPDGVLWATVGPQANILNLFSRWGTLLGIPRTIQAELQDEDAWAHALRDTIGMRRMLLIIDDPWDIHAALSFKVGGPCCAYLLTTRSPDLARRFTAYHAYMVPELTQEESLVLLSHLAPHVAEQDPQPIRDLLHSVGGLPLAITLIGRYVHIQASSGQPRHLHAALERLRLAEERLCLAEPQSSLERHSSLPVHTPLSLAAVIATSEQLLTENARRALATLSLFPAKPNSFAEEAVLSFPHISLEEIDQLLQTGLLESQSPGRYMLHQTIADHAHLTLHSQNMLSQSIFLPFVRYYIAFAERYRTDVERLATESANILTALDMAYTEHYSKELARGISAFADFLLLGYQGRYTASVPLPAPRREHLNTYLALDSSEEELTRLRIQGQMLTASMGGVLPEQPDPVIFERVLDVGCGTGDWLIEAAKTYPTMTLLVGGDVNSRTVDYAQAEAEIQGVSDRVQFRTMDALRPLQCSQGSFDLVNQRLGMSYLRTWDWPKLLQEFLRVTKPGGIIRLTEGDVIIESNSPALMQASEIFLHAFSQAGHLFTPDRLGVINNLAPLLSQQGVLDVQTCMYALEYRAGTSEWACFFEDIKRLLQTFTPFALKWGTVPEDAEALGQQALREMQRPDFVAIWRLLTAWGTRP